MSVIITFMFEPAKLQMNCASASGTSIFRKDAALAVCPAFTPYAPPCSGPPTRPGSPYPARAAGERGSTTRRPSNPAVVRPLNPWPARRDQSAAAIASGSAGT